LNRRYEDGSDFSFAVSPNINFMWRGVRYTIYAISGIILAG